MTWLEAICFWLGVIYTVTGSDVTMEGSDCNSVKDIQGRYM